MFIFFLVAEFIIVCLNPVITFSRFLLLSLLFHVLPGISLIKQLLDVIAEHSGIPSSVEIKFAELSMKVLIVEIKFAYRHRWMGYTSPANYKKANNRELS